MTEISRYSVEELETYDFFAGHFDWSYFDFLGSEVCAFSMIREPHERILSQFFYLRTLPTIYGEAFTQEKFPLIFDIVNKPPRDTFLSPDVFRRNAIRDGFDNLYTYYFFGRGYRGAMRASVAGVPRERVLEIARSNMRRMQFVGSYEGADTARATARTNPLSSGAALAHGTPFGRICRMPSLLIPQQHSQTAKKAL